MLADTSLLHLEDDTFDWGIGGASTSSISLASRFFSSLKWYLERHVMSAISGDLKVSSVLNMVESFESNIFWNILYLFLCLIRSFLRFLTSEQRVSNAFFLTRQASFQCQIAISKNISQIKNTENYSQRILHPLDSSFGRLVGKQATRSCLRLSTAIVSNKSKGLSLID